MVRTPAERAVEMQRGRRLVQAAGLIFYLLAVQGLAAAGVGAHVYFDGGKMHDLVLPATGGVLAVCYALVGFFLRRYRVWARNFAFAFAAVALFFFPVGTVLGAVIVLCIDRANRAGVFPTRAGTAARGAMLPLPAPSAEELAALVPFEPELTAERAG